MNFRTLQSTALICLSLLFIQCGPAKSKNKQTEQKQTKAPRKEEYIVKKMRLKILMAIVITLLLLVVVNG